MFFSHSYRVCLVLLYNWLSLALVLALNWFSCEQRIFNRIWSVYM